MRLFSIVLWHHFAYMMISVALLGYGAAGTLCRRSRGRALLAHFAPALRRGRGGVRDLRGRGIPACAAGRRSIRSSSCGIRGSRSTFCADLRAADRSVLLRRRPRSASRFARFGERSAWIYSVDISAVPAPVASRSSALLFVPSRRARRCGSIGALGVAAAARRRHVARPAAGPRGRARRRARSRAPMAGAR